MNEMEKSDFTVTLPSNSNVLSYPSNRGHNYVVRLSTPISLASQTLNDDPHWEVALTTVQYTNTFYQLREDVTIYAVVIVPNVESIQIHSPFGKTIQLDVDFTMESTGVRELRETQRRILRPFVKDATNKDEKWFVVLGEFIVPAGEYKVPLDIARRVVKGFNSVFSNFRYQYRMQVERVGSGGRFRFTAESKLTNPIQGPRAEPPSPRPDGIAVDYGDESRLGKYNFLLYTQQIAISPPLGQVLASIDDKDEPIYYISPISANTPLFSTAHSLYVYSDIIDHQRVGNTSAQLMDIVPVQGAAGRRVHYVSDPLTYLPVSRNYIETIHITIHDENGSALLFPDDTDNVICRLHFRRAGVRI
jgi:hypothetical protein